MVGSSIGIVATVILGTAALWLVGLETSSAVGVATFAAVWVGPGFGVLFGAVTVISRNERAIRSAAR